MKQLINNYIKYQSIVCDSKGTKKYNSVLVDYILKYEKTRPSADLNLHLFVCFYKENTRLSNTTINKLIKFLRQVYKFNNYKCDALFNFKLLKEKKQRFNNLKKDELKKIFTYVETSIKKSSGIKYATMLYLLYDVGVRPNELFNIKTENVNLKERYILLETTKTGEPRFVFMSCMMAKRLKAYLKIYDHTYLFFNDNCNRLFTLNDLKNFFRRVKQATGIKRLHAYMFRHTYITDLINLQIPMPVVQAQAGHKKLSTTMIYYHQSLHLQKQFLAKIKRE